MGGVAGNQDWMDEIKKKLVWLALIFPGFLTVTVIGSIVDLGETGEFSLTFYALALTFVDATLAFLLTALLIGALKLCCVTLSEPAKVIAFFIVLLAIAVVLGVAMGISAERGTLYAWVRNVPLVNVLNKRSQARPLIFVLRKNSGGELDLPGDVADARPQNKVSDAWLRVYLDGNIVYEGWPEFYDAKPTELYLSPACTITENANGNAVGVKVPGPGVFIPESQMKRAILVDKTSSPCWHLYFTPSQQPTASTNKP